MSSPVVRTEFRNAWSTLTPTLPFVETLNDSPSNIETEVPVWATFIFGVISRSHVSMGANPWIEERGVATIAIMSYSGTGDQFIAGVAGLVIKAWDMWISADRSIWVSSVEGPRPPEEDAVGDSYRLAVTINYVYQTQGGL